ncbi:MAG: hypothetical protein ACI9LY_002916 [Arenicella sp.]|jgi:hypothetical protein
MSIEQEITQKKYQAKLEVAGGLIDKSRNKLNESIDVFLKEHRLMSLVLR